jgi:FMN reductase
VISNQPRVQRGPLGDRRLVVVVGNPKPASRTLTIAKLVAAKTASTIGATHVATVDLCDYADALFRWPDDDLAVISKGVAAADVLVVASPIYKGSYTGLLKAFLDRYPYDALAGVTAIPVMTGSDPKHGLAPDFTLGPLLAELGASIPARGLFFDIANIGHAATVIDQWAATSLRSLRTSSVTSPARPRHLAHAHLQGED